MKAVGNFLLPKPKTFPNKEISLRGGLRQEEKKQGQLRVQKERVKMQKPYTLSLCERDYSVLVESEPDCITVMGIF